MKDTRADIRLVELGLAESREKARSLIMAGAVFSGDGTRVEKPGESVREDSALTVKADPMPFVSRGGLKLDKAIRAFRLSLAGKTALDIGASTGGFTDCMLQHGAKRVFAVDVGYGQLDWRLRNDPRVTVMERRNARYMAPDWFDEIADFATIDVSFISIKLILKPLYSCLAEGSYAVALVKPQFEAGRDRVGKHGVVRERGDHIMVLHEAIEHALDCGFQPSGIDYSPITGPKGNIEFLMQLKKTAQSERAGTDASVFDARIALVVDEAHNLLK